ncbi:hypothetical protein OpiT1DRAFT_03278 [Opitutaceae bacterium TAV1]|nr:hypothetical protein OpiT1DRAFT_03278 [Opitutaceae bacterium TAV1]
MLCPANTYAYLVGVETYALGTHWDLPGPINDVFNLAEWFVSRGVPPAHLTLFITPRFGTASSALPALPSTLSGVRLLWAEHASVKKTLTEEIPHLGPALVWIHWSGHGVIHEGCQRLFCTDATTARMPLNIHLHALRQFLERSIAPSPRRLVFTIDACSEDSDARTALPDIPPDTYSRRPAGTRTPHFTLNAARPGEVAINSATLRTGLFTDELRAQLKATPAHEWPPPLDAILGRLRERFTAFQRAGQTTQCPAFFESRDWDGNEQQLSIPPGSSPPLAAATSTLPPLLQIAASPACESYDAARPVNLRYRIEAWLWSRGLARPLDTTRWPVGPHAVADLARILPTIVVQALAILPDDRMRIELILPRELLDSGLDRVACGADPADTLGCRWPVILRPYDRLYHDGRLDLAAAHRTSLRKWREANSGAAASAWACDTEAFTEDFLRQLRTKHIVAALALPPWNPAANSRPRDPLQRAILHGIPLAAWLHDHRPPAADARQILSDRLVSHPPTEWPEKLHALRADGLPAEFACSGLSVLYDDADHLPPDLDSTLQAPPLLSTP